MKFRAGSVYISKIDHFEDQTMSQSELNSMTKGVVCLQDKRSQGACSEWFEKGVDVGRVVSNR